MIPFHALLRPFCHSNCCTSWRLTKAKVLNHTTTSLQKNTEVCAGRYSGNIVVYSTLFIWPLGTIFSYGYITTTVYIAHYYTDCISVDTSSLPENRKTGDLRWFAVFRQTRYVHLQGAPKKSNPLGKIRYLQNCSKFFHQIHRVYRGGFRPHILQISLKYLVAFKNYNYLNLNVHF